MVRALWELAKETIRIGELGASSTREASLTPRIGANGTCRGAIHLAVGLTSQEVVSLGAEAPSTEREQITM